MRGWTIRGIAISVCIAATGCHAEHAPAPFKIPTGPTEVYLTHPVLPELKVRVPPSAFELFPSPALHRASFSIRMPISRAGACDGLEPFVASIGLSTPDYFKRVVSDDEKFYKIPMHAGVPGPMGFTKNVNPSPYRPVVRSAVYTASTHDAVIQCDEFNETYFSHCDGALEVPIDAAPRRSMIVYLQRKPEFLDVLVKQIACAKSQIRYIVGEPTK